MLTERIEKIRQNYVNAKPEISCERAKIWTESHKRTEGLPFASAGPGHFMTAVWS